MLLRKLRAKNLFRFDDTEIDFTKYGDNKVVTVLGRNYDSVGVDSNGSGKSSLFEIIAWVLFGKPLRKSFVTDVIRRGTKEGMGEVTIEMSNGDIVVVRRARKAKGSTGNLELFVNGEDITGRKDTQRMIYNYLGFNNHKKAFDDFQNMVLLSRSTIDLFASSKVGPKERVDLIKRVLGINVLIDAAKLANETRKVKSDAVESVEREIGNIKAALVAIGDENLLNKIVKDSNNKLKVIDTDIKSINKEIEKVKKFVSMAKECQGIDTELKIKQETLDRLDKFIKSANDFIKDKEKLSGRGTDALNKKVEEYKKEIVRNQESVESIIKKQSKLESERNSIDKEIRTLQKGLSAEPETFVCPNCNETLMFVKSSLALVDLVHIKQYNKDKKSEIDSKRTELKEVDESIAKWDFDFNIRERRSTIALCNGHIHSINEQINTINNAKESIKEKQDELDGYVEERESVSKEAGYLNEKLYELLGTMGKSNSEQAMDDYSNRYEELSKKINTLVISKTDVVAEVTNALTSLKKIEEVNKKLDDKKLDLERVKDEERYWQFWVTGFPEVARQLVESALPYFENRTNYYLELLSVVERVKFSTLIEKRNADGYKSGFDIQVWDGEDWANFDMYSEGEKTRVALSISFGLRDLVAQSSGTPIGFFLCDEVADSLDMTGIKEFFNMLSKLPGSKFVISHKTDDLLESCADDTIIIERKNNVSKVA